MKLMTLNIWGGHVRDPLLAFIEKHQDVDVFCFQEVYHNAPNKISNDDRENTLNIFSELHSLLPDFHAFFTPVVNNCYGIGMFVRKSFEALNEGNVIIHENLNYPGFGPTHSRHLQWVELCFNKQKCSVLNVHGLWNGKGKTDTSERLAQSQKIRTFVDSITGPKILCGDFNLRPDTESIKILEKGMMNLICAHNINSTRTSLYEKEEKFADYVFTCPKIVVNAFKVLEDEVSDHSPLLLDFKILS